MGGVNSLRKGCLGKIRKVSVGWQFGWGKLAKGGLDEDNSLTDSWIMNENLLDAKYSLREVGW